MSLLILIDGYNVLAPVAPPARDPDARWLQRERMQLIDRLVLHLDPPARRRTCVVFDAADPPADRPSRFDVQGIDVRFAVDYPEADDLLEELIASHHAPKTLTVVSSDQRIQTAAKRRGCLPWDAQDWLDRLLDGHVGMVPRRGPGRRAGQGGPTRRADKPTPGGEEEVEQWMREFGFDEP